MNAQVIQLPGQRAKEPREVIKDFADQNGWGAYHLAVYMIRAATPEERRQLPSSACALSWQWDKWLDGETIPDITMPDTGTDRLYHLLIARMMGTTPDKIWLPRQPGARSGANAELESRYSQARRKLHAEKQELETLLEKLHSLQDSVSSQEEELSYLKALLSVPAPAPSIGHSA